MFFESTTGTGKTVTIKPKIEPLKSTLTLCNHLPIKLTLLDSKVTTLINMVKRGIVTKKEVTGGKEVEVEVLNNYPDLYSNALYHDINLFYGNGHLVYCYNTTLWSA
jgi:hypothetical protein